MMAFKGVRSSWLILARNRLLAALACSAASLARSRSPVRDATWRSMLRSLRIARNTAPHATNRLTTVRMSDVSTGSALTIHPSLQRSGYRLGEERLRFLYRELDYALLFTPRRSDRKFP